MTQSIRQALVVARRDFLAIVATPTFLLFLLAPLLMLGLSALGGIGAAAVAGSSTVDDRLIVIAPTAAVPDYRAADDLLRAATPERNAPPPLTYVLPLGDSAEQAERLLHDPDQVTRAVIYGEASRPVIFQAVRESSSGDYLAALATQVLRAEALGAKAALAADPQIVVVPRANGTSRMARNALALAAVMTLFILTLILASQSVGMMAEEKGNKVIEILAAAAPLEAVFYGKLIGMLGVAFLFIAFWAVLGGIALWLLAPLVGEAATTGAMPAMTPAVGWPLFALLCITYFVMAFLILGALFLGVGAQAATVREIQMLSLPITILQMAMFGLATAAAGAPGTTVARIAEIIPFSSPFAMAARSVHDGALWPHALAILWQAGWVALVVALAVRLFRSGVLKSGSGWWSRLTGRRKRQAAPDRS